MNQLVSRPVLQLSKIEHLLLLLACREYKKDPQELVTINKKKFTKSLGEKMDDNQCACHLKSLFQRQFAVSNSFADSRWIDYFEVNDNGMAVSLSYTTKKLLDDILPLLENTHKNKKFQFKSSYSLRLYMILSNFINERKTPEFSVKVIRQLLTVEDHEYPRMGGLKKYVIDRAVSEITKQTEYNVHYEQKIKGRAISHFIFHIIPKNQEESTTPEPTIPQFKLTPSQINYFSSLLSTDVQTHEVLTPPIGADYQEYQILIEKHLSDPKTMHQFYDLLIKHGYKNT